MSDSDETTIMTSEDIPHRKPEPIEVPITNDNIPVNSGGRLNHDRN